MKMVQNTIILDSVYYQSLKEILYTTWRQPYEYKRAIIILELLSVALLILGILNQPQLLATSIIWCCEGKNSILRDWAFWNNYNSWCPVHNVLLLWVDLMIPRSTQQLKSSMEFGCITTIKTVEIRGKNFLPKSDMDMGMKKAQKQDVIQNGTIIRILHPFLHST